ncbi:hypothetical protein IV203_005684 [Nitzschia inconspicua]|uniref:Uncharacterized protein n=1 Tax=Nitzschia inconspicua TaxID=303405 RepID=A0A9K3PGQ8_9STRA|nr:hypothetical protein IV203_005684 [Nitzschia inconspicua]
MTTSAVLKLIGTGIGLGIVHVLTGPDHLSAIATLSASNNSFTSFFWVYDGESGIALDFCWLVGFLS